MRRACSFAGEPRRLDDPANRAFLDSMARGECPAELEPASRSTPVNVNLVRAPGWATPGLMQLGAVPRMSLALACSQPCPGPMTGRVACILTIEWAIQDWCAVPTHVDSLQTALLELHKFEISITSHAR